MRSCLRSANLTVMYRHYAPYPLHLLRTRLSSLLGRTGLVHARLEEPSIEAPARCTLYIRIDVDTRACAENLPRFLDVFEQAGARPAVSFRVDPAAEYAARTLSDSASRVVQMGGSVGLHTVAYVQDDYRAEFRREVLALCDALTLLPTVVTVHGLGAQRADVRRALSEELPTLLAEHGIAFTDAGQLLRTYHSVFEDCAWDAATSRRYLDERFFAATKDSPDAQNVLLLVHPCYWDVAETVSAR